MPCKSGSGFIWYQIPAPITTLFYSKPESDMHVNEMIIDDLFLFNLPLAIPATIIAVASANSSFVSLSAMFIFGTRNFRSRHIWYEKPALENGVDLWCQILERLLWVLWWRMIDNTWIIQFYIVTNFHYTCNCNYWVLWCYKCHTTAVLLLCTHYIQDESNLMNYCFASTLIMWQYSHGWLETSLVIP